MADLGRASCGGAGGFACIADVVYSLTTDHPTWWCLVVAIVVGLVASPVTRALSGGVNFDSSTQPGDLGPSYFGTVTDQDGTAVPDAKLAITAPLLGRTIVQRSDAMGHFFVEGLDKAVTPKDVRIICLKEGYAEGTASKTLGASPDAPVDVVCILRKK